MEQQQPLQACRAWEMTRAGDPSNAEYLKLADRTLPPTLRSGQVKVKVASAALNPIDYKVSEGKLPMVSFPFYPGYDFAGEVVEAAPDSGFAVGQEVFGDSPNSAKKNLKGGTLSEFIVVNKTEVAAKPAALTSIEASSLPLVGQTALDCMTCADLPAGSRILILGASGGVGTAAVQICKARDLHVTGVCSGKNKELVMGLGADEVVDYKEHDWSAYLQDKKVDVVFDFAPSSAASTEHWDKSKKVLLPGGKFITISGPDSEGRMSLGTICGIVCSTVCRCCYTYKYYVVLKQTTAEKLKELATLVDAKKLKPVVEKTYGFAEANAAFAHLMTGRAIGKICVTVPN